MVNRMKGLEAGKLGSLKAGRLGSSKAVEQDGMKGSKF
jgi:hypothetical protein